MTPSLRTQPAHVARREGSLWVVVLPDGTRIASPSDVVVRQRVRAEAQASVRFERP